MIFKYKYFNKVIIYFYLINVNKYMKKLLLNLKIKNLNLKF
jgi:hypothetical protein